MPAFFEAGFDVHAMSFRGHGQKGWRLNRLGLESYVEDLRTVVARLPRLPVIVGHSLGGFVTLRLLEQMSLPGALLLSPVPPDGVVRSMVGLAVRSPVSVAKLLSAAIDRRVTALGAPPVGIYSDSADPVLADEITGQLQAESLRALGGVLRPRRLELSRIDTPIHCFGADGDYIIPSREVRRVAEILGAAVTIFPGMSHTFQAEREWRRVADAMLRWIDELPGSGRATAASRRLAVA